jgi:hypothetical protein
MLGQILTFRICAFAVTLPGFARNEANVTLILGRRDHPGSENRPFDAPVAKTRALSIARRTPSEGIRRDTCQLPANRGFRNPLENLHQKLYKSAPGDVL